jgi:hypothetical protein
MSGNTLLPIAATASANNPVCSYLGSRDLLEPARCRLSGLTPLP